LLLLAAACSNSDYTCADACEKQVAVCGIEPLDMQACTSFCKSLSAANRNLECFEAATCAQIADGVCGSGSCAPSCSGRECGDDGCGGSCGSCADGVCDASGTCSAGCPDNSTVSNGSCVCDDGYVFSADCATCIPDDSNGCGSNAYFNGSSCTCALGYQPSTLGCGCEPAGTVGSPCANNSDCAGSSSWIECATIMTEWYPNGQMELTSTLPGGYCTLVFCGSPATETTCEQLGGVCAEVTSEIFACMVPCTSSDQCRDGYQCRALTEANETIPGTYCLP
jgi:hypothetical protein